LWWPDPMYPCTHVPPVPLYPCTINIHKYVYLC
jgi:hypothetical protein